MAEAITMRGNQLLTKLGDGADPEVFTHPCLINTSRGISFTSENNNIIVPDCANPSDPKWTRVIKSSMTATVSGSGTLHLPDVETYFDFYQSPDSKNMEIVVGILADTVGGYFSGAFILTEFEITGEEDNLAQVALTFQSDGLVAWTVHT